MSIGIGTNLIRNQNFHYLYIPSPDDDYPVNRDYQITPFQTLNYTLGFAYSVKLNKGKKYNLYADVEGTFYWNAEKYYIKGTNNFTNNIEATVANYYSGFSTNLNFTVLKNLTRSKIGFFIGIGGGSPVYFKQTAQYNDFTNHTYYKGTYDDLIYKPEIIRVNVNVGIEYRYKIGKRNFTSRLYMSPQISKTQILSNKDFNFNTRNYITFFSTAIIL